MFKGVFTRSANGDMSLLEAFNYLGRHSLCTNSFVNYKGDFHTKALIGVSLYGGPFLASIFKNDFKYAVIGTGIIGGHLASKYIYNRIKNRMPLGQVSGFLSKIDIPLFLGGNLYMSQTYLRDIIAALTFTGNSTTNMADVGLLLVSAFAVHAALPDFSFLRGSTNSTTQQKLLPAPSNKPDA